MIPSTQKPPGEARDAVGRPPTGETPIRQIRIPGDEWDGLKRVTGHGHVRVLREFIRWYLRRPGAKLPTRPSAAEIAEGLNARSDAE